MSEAEASASQSASGVFGFSGDPAEKSKCERLVSRAMTGDAKVRTLQQALNALGVATGGLVRCDHCPDNVEVAGGYVPSDRQIVLCQQWMAKAPAEVQNTLAHEMIHAYDDARAYLDWTDLKHQACTEIRAASLSGDCTWTREIDRGNVVFRLSGAGSKCVRRRAELSVAMNPACPSATAAREAVDSVFTHCFADRAPFSQNPINPILAE